MLTLNDLEQIRTVISDEVNSIMTTRVDPQLHEIKDDLESLNNDIKDIYEMISEFQKLERQVAHFEKYDLEQKILNSYKNILALAKEAGIKLPR